MSLFKEGVSPSNWPMEAIAPPKTAIHLGAKMEGNRATGVERQAKRVYLAHCVVFILISCSLFSGWKHLFGQPTRAYPIAGIHEDFEGSIPCLFNCSSTTPRDLRLPFIRQLITTLAASTNHSRPMVILNGLGEYIPLLYLALISAINTCDW